MDLAALSWGSMTVVGVSLLLIVIAVAALRNRVSRRTEDVSEAATRDLYEEEDRAHRNDGNGGY